MKGLFCLEGIIGSGKTTTARLLASSLKVSFLGEDAQSNPFLTKFYSNPEKFALETELGFLLVHYHQLFHQERADCFSDFAFAKDVVFARMNLRGRDFEIFKNLYDELNVRLVKPEAVFYLNLPPQHCLRRIKGRGLPAESSISLEYLTELQAAYYDGLQSLGDRVYVVDVDESETPTQVAGKIENVLKELATPLSGQEQGS